MRELRCAGLAACFVCHDGEGKFLLAKSFDEETSRRDSWEGGWRAIASRESPASAIASRVLVLCGAPVEECGYLGSREWIEEGAHYYVQDYCLRIDPFKAAMKTGGSIEKVGWFALRRMPTPLNPRFLKFLTIYRLSLQDL